MRLLGRGDEQRALERIVGAARAGTSGALVIRGEAGIGKTSLLHFATQLAPDFETLAVAGSEDQVGYGFASLQRFVQPLHERLSDLHGGNLDAARAAFGLDGGPLPDRFVVGLALLELLARTSVDRPVLCVVDDIQWLDPESLDAFALVARRAHTERVAVLFGARDGAPPIPGVPDLHIRGLSERPGLELLRLTARGPIAADVARRVVAETDGSPLGIIELARMHTATQLDDLATRPEPLPVARRLEDHYLSRVRELPPATQTLLLLIAADTTGRTTVVIDAAAALEVGTDAAAPARDADVIGTPDLAFRHPLIRSAVYTVADATDRRRVHAALAGALEAHGDVDGRTWHLAAAASGPHEDTAGELEHAARRAAERGAHSAAATFWLRAADLSVEPTGRSDRLLAAATSHLAAGSPQRARSLLEETEAEFTDPFHRARRLLLLGSTRYVLGEAIGTTSMLMTAATELAPFDIDLARDAVRYALAAARIANRFARTDESYWTVLEFLQTFPLPARPAPSLPDRLIEAQAALWRNYQDAVTLLRPCLDALVADDDVSPNGLLWISFGCWSAGAIADEVRLRQLAERLVADGRIRRAPEALSGGLLWLGMSDLLSGSLIQARRHFAERANILDAVGHRVTEGADVFDVLMTAWAGRADQTRANVELLERAALERSHGWVMSFVEYAITVLELGLGNYAAAFDAAMTDFRHHPLLAVMSFPDQIEAAVRSGHRPAAEQALAELTGRALPSGTPVALGLLERSRALLAADDDAERHYRAALEHLQRCEGDLQVARTQLVYGEWLRRRRRRADAREQLRLAHATFDTLGAGAFAERSRIELAATGAHARRRSVDTLDDLTPQEAQITELAAGGATNGEIAATLYISASTVDYHLGKIYRKLGFTSRRELHVPGGR